MFNVTKAIENLDELSHRNLTTKDLRECLLAGQSDEPEQSVIHLCNKITKQQGEIIELEQRIARLEEDVKRIETFMGEFVKKHVTEENQTSLNTASQQFWKGDGYTPPTNDKPSECEHKWKFSHKSGNEDMYTCKCGLVMLKRKKTAPTIKQGR